MIFEYFYPDTEDGVGLIYNNIVVFVIVIMLILYKLHIPININNKYRNDYNLGVSSKNVLLAYFGISPILCLLFFIIYYLNPRLRGKTNGAQNTIIQALNKSKYQIINLSFLTLLLLSTMFLLFSLFTVKKTIFFYEQLILTTLLSFYVIYILHSIIKNEDIFEKFIPPTIEPTNKGLFGFVVLVFIINVILKYAIKKYKKYNFFDTNYYGLLCPNNNYKLVGKDNSLICKDE